MNTIWLFTIIGFIFITIIVLIIIFLIILHRRRIASKSDTNDDAVVTSSTYYDDSSKSDTNDGEILYTLDDDYVLKFTKNAGIDTLTSPILNVLNGDYTTLFKITKIDYTDISDILSYTTEISFKGLYSDCYYLVTI